MQRLGGASFITCSAAYRKFNTLIISEPDDRHTHTHMTEFSLSETRSQAYGSRRIFPVKEPAASDKNMTFLAGFYARH